MIPEQILFIGSSGKGEGLGVGSLWNLGRRRGGGEGGGEDPVMIELELQRYTNPLMVFTKPSLWVSLNLITRHLRAGNIVCPLNHHVNHHATGQAQIIITLQHFADYLQA